MAAGRVVEEGPPAVLLRDPAGHYARLCATAGLDGGAAGAGAPAPARAQRQGA